MNSFIEQCLIFLISAIIFVPLFQKLGLGSVVGFIVSGIVIGPFGLKFFQQADSILHFSELGVVLLLFVIGLEIQPKKLWSMRRHLLGLGVAQVVFCTIVFSLALFAILKDPLISIVTGFALSISSTAFAIQSLKEKNQFNTEFGRSSFSILLMQDILAIPAMALIPSLFIIRVEEGSGSLNGFKGLAVIILLFVISRYLFNPLFRFVAQTRSKELFTAVALLIVLAIQAVMVKVGLSPALGTFIAGMLLADSEYRHELEMNIDPFKGLLMGLFFIAVGMSIDFAIVLDAPVKLFLATILYMFCKIAIIYFVSRMSKLSAENSLKVGLTISQGGEFAFVLLAILVAANPLATEISQFLIALITLSMVLSPIFTKVAEMLMNRKTNQPEYDKIENTHPEVIIAGFGRFGQTFGRILRAQSIPFVAIDHDPDQIELVRRFGNKVYYGDASRDDLLQLAGAHEAKYFVLAIQDVETSVKTAKIVSEKFPNLTIFARARNRGHTFDLMDLKIPNIKRDTFDASVNFAGELLKKMNFSDAIVEKIKERFGTHDELMLVEQYKVRMDDKSLVSVSRQAVAQLAQVLNDDTVQTRVDLKK